MEPSYSGGIHFKSGFKFCLTFPGHKIMYVFFSGKYVKESLPSVLESRFIHYGVI